MSIGDRERGAPCERNGRVNDRHQRISGGPLHSDHQPRVWRTGAAPNANGDGYPVEPQRQPAEGAAPPLRLRV